MAVYVERPLEPSTSRLDADGHHVASTVLDVSGMAPNATNIIRHRLPAPIRAVTFHAWGPQPGPCRLDSTKGDTSSGLARTGWDQVFLYVIPEGTSTRIVAEYS
jgi:hypothetical protein